MASSHVLELAATDAAVVHSRREVPEGTLPPGARIFDPEDEQELRYAGPSRLSAREPTPPDGLCLSYCLSAALALDEWRATRRDAKGFFRNPVEESVWKERAQTILSRVMSLMTAHGGMEDRVVELGRGQYPGDDEMRFFSQVLGAAIVVRPDVSEEEYQLPLIFGTGPIGMEVYHTYVCDPNGNRSGHYVLDQVWFPEPDGPDNASAVVPVVLEAVAPKRQVWSRGLLKLGTKCVELDSDARTATPEPCSPMRKRKTDPDDAVADEVSNVAAKKQRGPYLTLKQHESIREGKAAGHSQARLARDHCISRMVVQSVLKNEPSRVTRTEARCNAEELSKSKTRNEIAANVGVRHRTVERWDGHRKPKPDGTAHDSCVLESSKCFSVTGEPSARRRIVPQAAGTPPPPVRKARWCARLIRKSDLMEGFHRI